MDELDLWIVQLSKTDPNAFEMLLYSAMDAMQAVMEVTGEIHTRFPRAGNPTDEWADAHWPMGRKAMRLVLRALAGHLHRGVEVSPPRYHPDTLPEDRERFDIDALAALLKAVGFKESWSPWEVWGPNHKSHARMIKDGEVINVTATLQALGIPRDWKPS